MAGVVAGLDVPYASVAEDFQATIVSVRTGHAVARVFLQGDRRSIDPAHTNPPARRLKRKQREYPS